MPRGRSTSPRVSLTGSAVPLTDLVATARDKAEWARASQKPASSQSSASCASHLSGARGRGAGIRIAPVVDLERRLPDDGNDTADAPERVLPVGPVALRAALGLRHSTAERRPPKRTAPAHLGRGYAEAGRGVVGRETKQPSHTDDIDVRPRLRGDAYLLPTSEGTVVGLSESPGGEFVVAGADAYRLLRRITPHLDGRRTIEALTAALPNGHRRVVRTLIARLLFKGFAWDGRNDQPHRLAPNVIERYESVIRYLSCAPSPELRFQRYRENPIAVVGSGPMLAPTVVSLFATGARELHLFASGRAPCAQSLVDLTTRACGADPERRLQARVGAAATGEKRCYRAVIQLGLSDGSLCPWLPGSGEGEPIAFAGALVDEPLVHLWAQIAPPSAELQGTDNPTLGTRDGRGCASLEEVTT